MATGKRGATKSSGAAKAVAIGAVVLVLGGVCLAGALADDDGGTTVLPPIATERADTVPILKRATDAQGICYGWRLTDGSAVVNVGSSLGDGVPAEGDPRCPRWVQVAAEITYTAESSESEDSALVDVEGSADLDRSDLSTVRTGLARFGLTEDAFLDDPGWAVTRAAVSLPLLVAEVGAASPAPAAAATPASTPTPLPDAGNDLWRDRWGYLLTAVGLLLLTALLVTVGLVQRRRQRRPPTATATPATPRPADAAAGRTPERG
ncbi:hypothetical protein ABTX15_03915 [Micromonospora sp. NPDC094482]|uniref:hypothetical protein n=1 Tax=unclassified Micromonospora TaxID=2617518 RepID=UPI00332B803A